MLVSRMIKDFKKFTLVSSSSTSPRCISALMVICCKKILKGRLNCLKLPATIPISFLSFFILNSLPGWSRWAKPPMLPPMRPPCQHLQADKKVDRARSKIDKDMLTGDCLRFPASYLAGFTVVHLIPNLLRIVFTKLPAFESCNSPCLQLGWSWAQPP